MDLQPAEENDFQHYILKKKHSGRVILLFLFLCFSVLSMAQQSDHRAQYYSFEKLADMLETKYSVKIFYDPVWFEGKKFHKSILQLPLKEVIEKIKQRIDHSVLFVDKAIVFVPNESAQDWTGNANSIIIVGNMNEFGKLAKATASGKIVDGKTGEPLIGAVLYEEELNVVATSDKNGDFTMTLPVGVHNIKLSYIGYEDAISKIKLVSNGEVVFDLFEKSVRLDEVVISAESAEKNIKGTQMSMFRLNSKTIKELPMALGEVDIIKSVSLMPGIQSTGEFGTGFVVRGGSTDQNLVLLEDMPIFNTSHVFGLTSAINPDAVKDFSLWKAGIPSKYGERASSVMDIHMGTRNKLEKFRAKGGIGLINTRLNFEIPFFDKKVSLLLGGRSSYSDWLLHKMPDEDLMNSSAGFYDLNALLNIKINQKNRLSFFGYYSADRFSLSYDANYKYSNAIGSVKWKHVFKEGLSSNLVAGFSDYAYNMNFKDSVQTYEAYQIDSRLKYRALKWSMSWNPHVNHSLIFGINTIYYDIMPGDLSPYGRESRVVPVSIQNEQAYEYGIFISDNITFFPLLSAEVGLRYSGYGLLNPKEVFIYDSDYPKSPESIVDTLIFQQGDVVKKYSGLEPRINLRYILDDNSSVKLSFNRMSQYINLVSNSSVMVPSDVWKLSSTYLKPLISDQIAVGYFRNFRKNSIETSVEAYYKRLTNVVEYKNNATILLNENLETDLINAKGYAYGIEFLMKKNSGRLTGWLSYTYSRSFTKTLGEWPSEQVNRNTYYPSTFDKPHSLVLNANYHISRRWRFAGVFTYSTGRPVTLPEYRYTHQQLQLVYYSDRNKYRLPDYHRLDISITLDESLRLKKKWKGSWTFSILNVYGRKNAYSVFYEQNRPDPSNNYRRYSLYKLYILGKPIPTFTYNFTF